jgi:hypothetical protein
MWCNKNKTVEKNGRHGKPSSIMQMIHDGFAVSAVFWFSRPFCYIKGCHVGMNFPLMIAKTTTI